MEIDIYVYNEEDLVQKFILKHETLNKKGLPTQIEEVYEIMEDLLEHGCDVLTIGQYLQPSKKHLPVQEFIQPDQFDEYKSIGLELGFRHVESSALVRSSYKAQKHIN